MDGPFVIRGKVAATHVARQLSHDGKTHHMQKKIVSINLRSLFVFMQ